jgi:hypothetical protein
MRYKKDEDIISTSRLRDAALAMDYGTLKSNARIQVKMPSFIVEEIDKTFPEVSRSQVLTKAVIEFLLNKKRFANNPDLGQLHYDEQKTLDTLLDYLEERERD